MNWFLIFLGVWFIAKLAVEAERRRRELDELRDRRAELEIKQQVLLDALERLRGLDRRV